MIGYGVLRVITRHIPYHAHEQADWQGRFCGCAAGAAGGGWCADAYLLCGMVCVTVYAQVFSLFARVGLAANVILCVVCVLIGIFDRKGLGGAVRGLFCSRKEKFPYGVLRWCIMIFLVLLFDYGTSSGMINYDTSLYHAQSIRWIEEYGVVKGLGNMIC